MTTKSIIKLRPKVSGCKVHVWTPLCLNMVFLLDNLGQAQQRKTVRVQIRGAIFPDHGPPDLTVAAYVSIELAQEDEGSPVEGLTCVSLAAHADVSVAGELGGLVAAALILMGHLGVLLRQERHSFGHVSIASLQPKWQL